MSHTQTKELKKIPIGSMDFFVIPWAGGEIPADNEIEVEANMIGRTKNGVTINYQAEWYKAFSDDGKATKRKLVGETVTIGYGNITWNGNTLKALTPTARVSEQDGKRTTKIGGVANDDEIRYLLRGVQKDKKDGELRITGVGVNTGGWSAVFANNSETILQPTFECEPIDDEGTLLYYEEEVIEPSASAAQTTSTESGEPETTEGT